jgi:hypothetical protein
MLLMRTRLLLACAALLATTAAAQSNVCPAQGIPLERQLRQLTLDLIGRPPTMAEYRFFQGKGAITEADINELMSREDFYARMKTYHRALLRSNISASVYNNGDTRLSTTADGLKPLELRGNPSAPLRGQNGVGCDHFIQQDSCNASKQDPHAEPATKACRDGNGVPLPVSYDYNTAQYACAALAAADCSAAVTAGLLQDKQLFFCDMRRQGDGSLKPSLCLPDPAKPQTAALTTEELDANGRVTAFVNPAPAAGQLARLDRCGLALGLRNNVKGSYVPQFGCIQREGVVPVASAPYWNPTATGLNACAIEAQTRTVNPVTMESCESGRFTGDRSCGCGDAMRRCEGADTSALRIAALNAEPLLITDSVLRRDEDYFNILTTRRSFVNGTLASFYRDNQNPTQWQVTAPAAAAVLPGLGFSDDPANFVEFIRDAQHSGVLTTPAWLLRFPTQRSRVAQFYDAFLCKHFAPPADAVVPPPEDSCNRENNLAKRCGCNYCHATIEPTGAHWGRFGERNAQYLKPEVFPKYDAKCRDCALAGNTTCDNECGNYVMQAYDGDGANSLGLLRTYLYRTPDEEPNIVAGPRLLVERMLQTGDLERCAVRNVWKEFVGRPMSAQEEGMYLETLARDFVSDGRNFKSLIRRVVTSDAYRRID